MKDSLNVAIVSVRVYAEKDSDLTRDKQGVSKDLTYQNKLISDTNLLDALTYFVE